MVEVGGIGNVRKLDVETAATEDEAVEGAALDDGTADELNMTGNPELVVGSALSVDELGTTEEPVTSEVLEVAGCELLK